MIERPRGGDRGARRGRERPRAHPQRADETTSIRCPLADALANFRNFHLYLLEATKNHLLVVAAAPIFTVLQSTVVRRRQPRK